MSNSVAFVNITGFYVNISRVMVNIMSDLVNISWGSFNIAIIFHLKCSNQKKCRASLSQRSPALKPTTNLFYI
jgi:hypothetical protein